MLVLFLAEGELRQHKEEVQFVVTATEPGERREGAFRGESVRCTEVTVSGHRTREDYQ